MVILFVAGQNKKVATASRQPKPVVPISIATAGIARRKYIGTMRLIRDKMNSEGALPGATFAMISPEITKKMSTPALPVAVTPTGRTPDDPVAENAIKAAWRYTIINAATKRRTWIDQIMVSPLQSNAYPALSGYF